MSTIKLSTPSSGSISLTPANTASNYTITVPAFSGTMIASDTSGNVGIGTASPSTFGKLAAVSADGSATVVASSATGMTRIYGYTAGFGGAYIDSANAAQNAFLPITINGSIASIATGGAERMRIDSSGNLCVGITGTLNGSRVTSRTPSGSTGYGLRSDSENTASTSWGHFYGTSSSNSVANIIIFGNGNVLNANNSYGGLSDIKLKENIVDSTPKLEKLNQVRVVNYNLKGETQKQIGVIAQELEQVFPSMIDESPDRDEEGNDLGTTTKSVKYSVFVPMLIKALQEQQALITQLQADVAELKGQSL